VVTTFRSVLNLINIDESGTCVNRDRGYGQKPNLRADLNRRTAVAVSRVAKERSRQALRGPGGQASPDRGPATEQMIILILINVDWIYPIGQS
jgi:hypothetical protein